MTVPHVFATDPVALATLAERYAHGDETALSEITPAVYEELKRVARNHLRHERAGHTLQATAIVNEAYARMCEATGLYEQSRQHFFRLASRVMRNVLVDHARSRNAEKHGGGLEFESLDQTAMQYHERCTQHHWCSVASWSKCWKSSRTSKLCQSTQ